MSRIRAKFIDRGTSGTSSRVSSPTTSGHLPTIPSRRLDSFSLSVRRHSSFQENPEGEPVVAPLRYHATEEISPKPKELSRYRSVKEKREGIEWLAHSVKMKEMPQSQIYQQQITQNVKRYGAGMLRRSHKNALGEEKSEQTLLQLHYRLKRQRELAIISREQRAAAQRFRWMLSRFESI